MGWQGARYTNERKEKMRENIIVREDTNGEISGTFPLGRMELYTTQAKLSKRIMQNHVSDAMHRAIVSDAQFVQIASPVQLNSDCRQCK